MRARHRRQRREDGAVQRERGGDGAAAAQEPRSPRDEPRARIEKGCERLHMWRPKASAP
jgi:hypothetical protein